MATRRHNAHEDGRQFFRRLRDEGLYSPIFILHGDEEFLVKEAEKRIADAAFPEGSNGLNDDQLDAAHCDGQDIANAANDVPMFAPQRLVRVRNADSLKAADLDVLADYADVPMETTVLVLRGTAFDGRTRAIKRLFSSPNVVAVKFPQLKERETEQWVARRAANYHLRVAKDVPALLVESVGPSLDLLDSALERMDLYLGGEPGEVRNVRRSLVEEVVVDTRTRAWFEMTDALLEKRAGDAIAQFRRAHEYGQSGIQTVSRVSFQFRSVLLVRVGIQRGFSGKDLADFAQCHSFLLRKFQAAARRFSTDELRWILQRIAATDHLLKSSRQSDLVLVERLFLDIAQGFAGLERGSTR